MSNRTLARADDNPGEILEDGELHKLGMWEEVTIERSAAGSPGLLFVITRYENDQMYDQMCVSVKDGAAFLAPVIAWLSGKDPEPWVYYDGTRRAQPMNQAVGNPYGFLWSFAPRPGYNQNREDYS